VDGEQEPDDLDVEDYEEPYNDNHFNETGMYANRVVNSLLWLWGATAKYGAFDMQRASGERHRKDKPPDLDEMQPQLGFAPIKVVEKTLDVTTQLYR
jgi:hypothetical protein